MDQVSEPITEDAEFHNWPVWGHATGSQGRYIRYMTTVYCGAFAFALGVSFFIDKLSDHPIFEALATLISMTCFFCLMQYARQFRGRKLFDLSLADGTTYTVPKKSFSKQMDDRMQPIYPITKEGDMVTVIRNEEVLAWARFADPKEGDSRWQTFLGQQRIELHLKPDLAPELRDDVLTALLDAEVFIRPSARREFALRQRA